MSIVCNKVTKIADFFRNTLNQKISKFKNIDQKISIFNPFQMKINNLNLNSLSYNLHNYQNFRNSQLECKEIELNKYLIDQIKNSLDFPQQNFGQDTFITALKSK